MIHLLDLNQDCLEHVMEFLDIESLSNISETCIHLNQVAERVFKKHKYYECEISNEDNIKEATKILKKFGSHLTKLHLKFPMVDAALYAENGVGMDFLLLVNTLLSEHFRNLTLSGLIWLIPILKLAPTLFKLEKLHICGVYTSCQSPLVTMSLDLPQLCPNLQTLIVNECGLIFAPNEIKSFQNLQALHFLSFGPHYPIDSFVLFIEENKQLKRLHISHRGVYDNDSDIGLDYDALIDLPVLGNNLKLLEELCIQTILFDDLVQGVTNLKGLNQITTLVMMGYWDDVEQINEVLHIVKSMKQLKQLWIRNHIINAVPNQQAIINIAVELKQLESLASDLKCDSETITEFIRHGRNLQRFCVELRGQTLTPNIIENLARVRAFVAGKHSPLLVYFHTCIGRDVVQVLDEPNIQRYLRYVYLVGLPYFPLD